MPEFRELHVWITMDGWKLDEHKVDVLARNACTCYVASYPGKVFAIKLQNDLDRHKVAFKVLVNGVHVHSQLCDPGDVRDVYGVTTYTWGVKPFMFERVQITHLSSNGISRREYGIIEVCAHRVEILEATETLVTDLSGPLNASTECHRVVLDKEVQSGWPHKRVRVKSLERKDEPFARFLIRFGPIDTLQAEGIMPLVETITTSSPTTGSHKESLIRRRDESDLCNENKLSTTVFPNLSQRSKSPEASKPTGANLGTLDLPASLSDIKMKMLSLQEALSRARAQLEAHRSEATPPRQPPSNA